MSFVANNEALLAKGLKALGDELSLTLLRALMNGSATASALAKRFQQKQWAVWRRLEDLCQVGLITRSARIGKTGQALYVALKDRIAAFFAAAMHYAGVEQEA